jgi:hypothetical protein
MPPVTRVGLSSDTSITPTISFGKADLRSPALPATFFSGQPATSTVVQPSGGLYGSPQASNLSYLANQSGGQVFWGSDPRSGEGRRESHGQHSSTDVNILVVDDYETIPAHLQRRIQDIAERSGARPRIMVVDDATEEDKQMDDLMKKVYERVS